jgi:hypothetical protein
MCTRREDRNTLSQPWTAMFLQCWVGVINCIWSDSILMRMTCLYSVWVENTCTSTCGTDPHLLSFKVKELTVVRLQRHVPPHSAAMFNFCPTKAPRRPSPPAGRYYINTLPNCDVDSDVTYLTSRAPLPVHTGTINLRERAVFHSSTVMAFVAALARFAQQFCAHVPDPVANTLHS